VGMLEGAAVGDVEGTELVGLALGIADGLDEGIPVGLAVGC
jgi:hypothetical protein